MNPTDLARRFGTPLYAYDVAALRRAYADLRAMLPEPSTLYYSLKANPHPLVVGQLHRLGCAAEVSSVGEADAALVAGIAAGDVLLTAPGKSAATIAYALARGVRRFSVDSPTDLRRVGSTAADAGVDVRCLLRVNADEPVSGMGLAMTGTPSQFGADLSWILREPRLFAGHGRARVDGLHLYMGTNLLDEDALVAQFDAAAAVAQRLMSTMDDLTHIDLGGGFGAPYARAGTRPVWPSLRSRVESILDDRLPGWRTGRLRIAFESGRYLAGDCGILLCGVLDVKVSKGQRFVVLDSGINHLGGMAGLRRLPPIVPTLVRTGTTDERETVATTVVGPLCTPLDSLLRNAPLPEVQTGDVLLVPNIGAYGLTASLMGFLGHRTPVEVVCDGETVLDASQLVINRQSITADHRPLDHRRAGAMTAAATV